MPTAIANMSELSRTHHNLQGIPYPLQLSSSSPLYRAHINEFSSLKTFQTTFDSLYDLGISGLVGGPESEAFANRFGHNLRAIAIEEFLAKTGSEIKSPTPYSFLKKLSSARNTLKFHADVTIEKKNYLFLTASPASPVYKDTVGNNFFNARDSIWAPVRSGFYQGIDHQKGKERLYTLRKLLETKESTRKPLVIVGINYPGVSITRDRLTRRLALVANEIQYPGKIYGATLMLGGDHVAKALRASEIDIRYKDGPTILPTRGQDFLRYAYREEKLIQDYAPESYWNSSLSDDYQMPRERVLSLRGGFEAAGGDTVVPASGTRYSDLRKNRTRFPKGLVVRFSGFTKAAFGTLAVVGGASIALNTANNLYQVYQQGDRRTSYRIAGALTDGAVDLASMSLIPDPTGYIAEALKSSARRELIDLEKQKLLA